MVRLIEGEATVNELAAPFDISQPAISRHLKVLEARRYAPAGPPLLSADIPLALRYSLL